MTFGLIEAERARHPVCVLCVVLGVTRAGFYAWKRRPPSARELRDRELMKVIARIHAGSRGTYGVPRIHAELEDDHGIQIAHKAGRKADAPPRDRGRLPPRQAPCEHDVGRTGAGRR
ncbi:MAG: transposase [Solirubrobacterales bacterium]|nr:transposase [Solirubrobacterales bacterium]MBV9165414.1 transposase [Solirubrobacterales bacterium]MBV9533902.1 transposase [Solirubrobacterales bacterium]